MVTYFMGGYSFSSKPPFRLLGVSNAPIVDESFYNGPWLRKNVCYVVYPTSLWLQGNDTLQLVMGFNDFSGYLLQISLAELLKSLVKVG